MPYNANVYNVMLASPGDVQEERQIAGEIIHEWNDLNSRVKKIVLLPIGWEYNIPSQIGEEPQ